MGRKLYVGNFPYETGEAELQELEGAFKGTDSAILVDYRGLKVPEVTELRRQVRVWPPPHSTTASETNAVRLPSC